MDIGKKQRRNYAPLISMVDSFKYFGVHITEGLTWALHTDCGEEGKAETVSPQTLEEISDIPSNAEEFLLLHHRERPDGEHHCLVWKQHQTGPQGPAKSGLTEHTVGGALPCLKDIYTRCCKNNARTIIKDPNHPDNGLFSLLRSRRRYRIHQASTERLRKSIYHQAPMILNEDTA